MPVTNPERPGPFCRRQWCHRWATHLCLSRHFCREHWGPGGVLGSDHPEVWGHHGRADPSAKLGCLPDWGSSGRSYRGCRRSYLLGRTGGLVCLQLLVWLALARLSRAQQGERNCPQNRSLGNKIRNLNSKWKNQYQEDQFHSFIRLEIKTI